MPVGRIESSSFADPWPKSFFSYTHNKSPDLFLVAADGDQIMGYIIGEIREIMFSGIPHRFKVGHILNVAVDTRTRRAGTGTSLMDEMERRFRERNASKATLEVRESNASARSFYRHLGYEEIGRVRAYYLNEDAVIMSKNL